MEELIQKLNEIRGVKNASRKPGPSLEIKLHSRDIPGSENFEIKGDLRSISASIRKKLEEARKNSGIQKWHWNVKPEKQYQETSIGTKKIKDRKSAGHKTDYYKITLEMK